MLVVQAEILSPYPQWDKPIEIRRASRGPGSPIHLTSGRRRRIDLNRLVDRSQGRGETFFDVKLNRYLTHDAMHGRYFK